jgi:hypothetical protein
METSMRTTRQADRDFDGLIDEITVDCHDEEEQLTGFEAAFDEDANFPCPATITGQPVDVIHVGQSNRRRELIATCQRNGRQYDIALLDLDIQADPTTSRLIAAYRRWIT